MAWSDQIFLEMAAIEEANNKSMGLNFPRISCFFEFHELKKGQRERKLIY